jgi:hypothetical protein
MYTAVFDHLLGKRADIDTELDEAEKIRAEEIHARK